MLRLFKLHRVIAVEKISRGQKGFQPFLLFPCVSKANPTISQYKPNRAMNQWVDQSKPSPFVSRLQLRFHWPYSCNLLFFFKWICSICLALGCGRIKTDAFSVTWSTTGCWRWRKPPRRWQKVVGGDWQSFVQTCNGNAATDNYVHDLSMIKSTVSTAHPELKFATSCG